MRTAGQALVLVGALACAGTPALGPAGADRSSLAGGAETPGPPDSVILVSVSGLTAARTLAADGGMPQLTKLARAGLAAERVEVVVPDAPYPVHTTLVTGVSPADHGVVADRLIGERGVRNGLHRHASLVRSPTLWQRVRESGLPVAALDWPTTLGADVQFLLPDVAPERSGEQWSELVAQGATPEIAAWVNEDAAALSSPGAARDAFLGEIACRLLRQANPPRLILMRLRQTEDPLARFGPGAPQVDQAFVGVDAVLGQLDLCLAELRDGTAPRGMALVVSGDRAILPVHTAIHPNVLLAEAKLLAVDREGRSSEWSAVARSNGGSAFVYARDAQTALRARRAFSAAAESSGAFRLVSAEEMIRQSADREAWFGLAASPGFAFRDSLGSRFLAPAARRGAAGYFDGEPRTQTPGFVAIGSGLRRGLRIPLLTQRDVAPTLAALMGVELSSATGRQLVGLLWAGAALASESPANPEAAGSVSDPAPPPAVAAPPVEAD